MTIPNRQIIPEQEVKDKLPERFWSKIKFDDPGNCWEWQAYRHPEGYGKYKASATSLISAHRYIYMELFGRLPSTLLVCHKCNNPSCVNPNHLYAGTNQDNTNDREAAGRGITFIKRGSQYGNAKLNEEKVAVIKQRLAAGHVSNEIAKDYGVSIALISMIKHGRNWTHVPLPR